MSGKRQRFTGEFKAKVALEAVKEQYTLAVHPTQITAWKKELKGSAVAVFAGKRELLTDELVETAKAPRPPALHHRCGLEPGWSYR